MNLSDKPKDEPLLELETLRARIADLEKRASERDGRFQSLFNEMTEGFALHEIICDAEGEPCDYRFLEVNPAFERLTGLKRNDVIGKSVREVLSEVEPYWIETYGAVALTGQPVRFENHSSPLKRHYEVFAYRPAPRQFAVLFTDITERKQKEEETQKLLVAVRQEKDKLTALVNSIEDEVWFADTQRRFTLANPSAVRQFHLLDIDEGVDVEKLAASLEVYRPDGSLRPIEEAPPLRALNGEVVRNQAEIIRTPATGELRYREVSSAPMRDAGGSIVGSVSVVRDITERKKAEEAILQAKEEWETTFDTVPDLIVILDAHHRVVRANRAMADRLGVLPDQCAGLHCHEAVHGLDHPPEFCPHTLTCQDGKEHHAEVHEPRLGGDFLVSTTPLCDGQGELIGSIHVARDITERKRVEDQIRRSLREKEVLLKEIHHRVKNNLQIIHSMLNLQMPYVKDEQAIALFKESQNRVFSMALVHEKLYQSESLARIDLPDYIRKITANLFQSYGVNERVITSEIDVEDVSLGVNTMIPCALIINELVSNSLKYAFPKSWAHSGVKGEVRISLRHDTDNKYVLTVSDNGVGLPEGFNIQESKSLGLQLVNVLARQLNGSAELGTGGGTEFVIAFEASR
jgi:PAS domain S-box-containing protein